MTIQATKSTDSLKVLWILWVQSVASLGIYIVVAHVGGDSVRGCINPGLSVEALRNVLLVTAIAELGLIQYLRKTMIAPRVSPSVSPSYENADRQHTKSYVVQYTRAVLTSLLISESVGFFGFILFVFGDSLNTLYMFVGISALYMLIYRPKSEEFEQLQSSTVAAHST